MNNTVFLFLDMHCGRCRRAMILFALQPIYLCIDCGVFSSYDTETLFIYVRHL